MKQEPSNRLKLPSFRRNRHSLLVETKPLNTSTDKNNIQQLISSYVQQENAILQDIKALPIYDKKPGTNSIVKPGTFPTDIFAPPPNGESYLLNRLLQVMNHCVKVQQENRRLRQQVFCLWEMRKIDEMKNDLIAKTNNYCDSPTPPVLAAVPAPNLLPSAPQTAIPPTPPITATLEIPNGCKSSSCSSRETSTELAADTCSATTTTTNAKAFVLPNCKLHESTDISESLPRDASMNRFAAGDQGVPTLVISCASSSSGDGRSAAASPTESHLAPPPRRLSSTGSDDQPIWAEVQLPTMRPPSQSSQTSSTKPQHIWSKFGFGKHLNKNQSTLTHLKSLMTNSVQSSSNGDVSMCSSISEDRTTAGSRNNEVVRSSSGGVTKVFLKKRKRKISESDSIASGSEASGAKPCQTIELPDIEYVQTLPHNVQSPAASSTTKGNFLKRGWLRKSKQQRLEIGPPQLISASSPINTSAKDLTCTSSTNTNTIDIEKVTAESPPPPPPPQMMNHSVSESNIKDLGHRNSPSPCATGATVTVGENLGSFNGLMIGADEMKKDSRSPSVASKSRSVTFFDQPSLENLSGLGASQLSLFSSDSVFAPTSQSQEADLNRYSGSLLRHVLILQGKNSSLIQRLKLKSQEYERITEQLITFEREVQTLRDRFRSEEELDHIICCLLEPNFIPIQVMKNMEQQIRQVDDAVRVAKQEAYEAQQAALEAHSKEFAISQKYMDELEKMQKANFHLLQRQANGLSLHDFSIRRRLDALPTYEALYSFATNLLRSMRQLRCKVVEKTMTISKLEMELLQTQCSLLLAHSQNERQKVELRFCGNRRLCRRHSYHGEDLIDRLVNAELSFFLPFKLQGSTMSRQSQSQTQLNFNDSETMPEMEYLQLFDAVKNLQNAAANVQLNHNYEELEFPQRANSVISHIYSPSSHYRPLVEPKSTSSPHLSHYSRYGKRLSRIPISIAGRRIPLEPPLLESIPLDTNMCFERNDQQHQRPMSCIVPESGVRKVVDQIAQGHFGQRKPVEIRRIPAPIRLGNAGQVKHLAAAFDGSVQSNFTSSAPNSPLMQPAARIHQEPQSKPCSPLISTRHYDCPPLKMSRSPVGSPELIQQHTMEYGQRISSPFQQNEHHLMVMDSPVSRKKPSPIYETVSGESSDHSQPHPNPTDSSSKPSSESSTMTTSSHSRSSSGRGLSKWREWKRKHIGFSHDDVKMRDSQDRKASKEKKKRSSWLQIFRGFKP